MRSSGNKNNCFHHCALHPIAEQFDACLAGLDASRQQLSTLGSPRTTALCVDARYTTVQLTCNTHECNVSRTATRDWHQCGAALTGQTRALAMTKKYQRLRSSRHETSQGSCFVDLCLLPMPNSGYTALAPRATMQESPFLRELRIVPTRRSCITLYSKHGLRHCKAERLPVV